MGGTGSMMVNVQFTRQAFLILHGNAAILDVHQKCRRFTRSPTYLTSRTKLACKVCKAQGFCSKDFLSNCTSTLGRRQCRTEDAPEIVICCLEPLELQRLKADVNRWLRSSAACWLAYRKASKFCLPRKPSPLSRFQQTVNTVQNPTRGPGVFHVPRCDMSCFPH